MKTRSNSLLLTAALALGAVAAYGQHKVVANIPFDFKTVAGEHPAGQYMVTQQGPAAKLTNVASGKGWLVGISVPEDIKPNQPAQLVFTCGSESGCALTGVRIDDGRTWKYPEPRLNASEDRRVAVIYLERPQAE